MVSTLHTFFWKSHIPEIWYFEIDNDLSLTIASVGLILWREFVCKEQWAVTAVLIVLCAIPRCIRVVVEVIAPKSGAIRELTTMRI